MEEFYFDVDVIGVRKKYSVYIMKKHPNGGVHLFKYRPENRSMSTLFWRFFTVILVSKCPACGPDVVLEFSARVGAWWDQGAERVGVDE